MRADISVRFFFTMEKIVKIVADGEYFSAEDTLCCGQVFRFVPHEKGYFITSADKRAYVYDEGKTAVVECLASDEEYFHNYFDLARDYKKIVSAAENSGCPVLAQSARLGKGIRILCQDEEEALFSFIVSQNNNIPRIKGIIERLCTALGDKKVFYGAEYYSFPTAEKMSATPLDFYKGIGLGYRAEYIKGLADEIAAGRSVRSLKNLSTEELRKELTHIKGVGPKVADCAVLFGFHRSDSFPADTWIEKVYREDFNGTLTDRKKISDYFVTRFGENSGYFQQYLFYYKRTLEKKEEKAGIE